METKTTLIIEEVVEILSDEEFLELLPEAQRIMVGAYAAIEGISCYQAFEELIAVESAENIADRARQHSA